MTGLAAGNSVVLRNNGGDDETVSSNGPFTFDTPLDDGSDYQVAVFQQPTSPAQTCTVSSGSGTIDGADVTDVSVTCVTLTFTIGGTVSGLTGTGLVLQNNGGDDLTIDADGSFTFSTALPDGSGYDVSVLTQPSGPDQTCTASSAQGTVAGADVTDVSISCS